MCAGVFVVLLFLLFLLSVWFGFALCYFNWLRLRSRAPSPHCNFGNEVAKLLHKSFDFVNFSPRLDQIVRLLHVLSIVSYSSFLFYNFKLILLMVVATESMVLWNSVYSSLLIEVQTTENSLIIGLKFAKLFNKWST